MALRATCGKADRSHVWWCYGRTRVSSLPAAPQPRRGDAKRLPQRASAFHRRGSLLSGGGATVRLMKLSPNRVAAYLTAGAALASGLAPVIAQMDVKDTASCLAAGAGVLTVFRGWLVGWREHELRQANLQEGQPPSAGFSKR